MPPIITKDVLLAPYTTLGVGGTAEYFAEVHSLDELSAVVAWAASENIRITYVGGGSNIVISDAGIRGLVIRIGITGITFRETGDIVFVTVGAGVVLDTLIAELVRRELWGLENLSSIPGTVGGVPIQNVGAYGVEAKDIIESVEIYDYEIGETRTLLNSACAFSYRDSIFKRKEGASYVVTQVTFRTQKKSDPKLSYADLQKLQSENENITIHDIRNAIIEIRQKKFPDWNIVGTAGSFFKNPIISQEQFAEVRRLYPDVKGFVHEGNMMKVSLGWILDHACGLRGYTEGSVGLYTEQALVLVCTKGVSSDVIMKFSQKIIDIVYEKTGISVEREVTLLT